MTTRALLFWSAAASATSSSCPSGVLPGQHYGSSTEVWKMGRADEDCDTSKLVFWDTSAESSRDKLNCVPADSNAEATCTYSPIGHGVYWCPVQGATAPTCDAASADPDCFESAACYGICRCVQCPCSMEGRSGRNCNVCEPPNCDEACHKRGILRPGSHAMCEFGMGFYSGFVFGLLFPDKLAQPQFEIRVKGDGDDIYVEFAFFYTLCTEKEKLLFRGKLGQCEVGVKENCQARGIATPCLQCQTTEDVYVPPGSTLSGTPSEALFVNTKKSGLLFGCNHGECRFYLQQFPLDFGTLQCSFGATCAGNSSLGAALGELEFRNDASADEYYFVYLVSTAGVFFVLVGCLIALGAMYRFKAAQDPAPLHGMSLAWEGLGLGDIIEGLRGGAAPGHFIGVLGTIGAGKSTLLNVLSGRLLPSKGVVRLNGREVSQSELQRSIGFVPQGTVCYARDTVGEAIGFSAAMCGGVFPEIGELRDKLDSRIGTLSGGQRRLVDVYVVLARRPAVLILDEPTTGLDSENARVLGKLLKEVSKSIPVIATMHQPRRELGELLTDVMLLRRGQCVFSVGSRRGSSSAMVGVEKLISEHSDTKVDKQWSFDHVMDLAADGILRSPPGEEETHAVDDVQAPSSRRSGLRGVPSVRWRLLLLFIRNSKRGLRHGPWKYCVTLCVSAVLGMSFYQVGDDSAGMRNRFGYLFLVHAFMAIQGVSATAEAVEVQVSVEHEVASHVYNRSLDALVRVTGHVVGQIPHALLLTSVSYPMVGLRMDRGRPVIFGLCMAAIAIASACCALLCRGRASVVGGFDGAALLNGALCFACGAFTSSQRMPLPIKWFVDMSFFKYSFEIVVAHEFSGLSSQITRGSEEMEVLLEDQMENADRQSQLANGDFYLNMLSIPYFFNDDFYYRCRLFGVVVAVWVVFAYVVLVFPATQCLWQKRMRRVPGQDVTIQKLSAMIDSTGSTSEKETKISVMSGPGATSTAKEAVSSEMEDAAVENHETDETICVDVDAVNSVKEVMHCTKTATKDSSETDKQEIELKWSNLTNADVSGLSGGMRTGNLLGIVGPCGSGKTTLLKMLAGRVRPSSGIICMNGREASPKELMGLVGYVPQEEWMCGEDTVSEAIDFARETAVFDPASWHEELYGRLSLVQRERKAAGASQPLGTLSPGQRRLVAVCVELARRPKFMALDEPTSGIDSNSSMKLANLIKEASSRVPVVLTIHQPRFELQSLLTHVLVMRRGEAALFMPYAAFVAAMHPDPEAPVSRTDSEATQSVCPVGRALEQLDSISSATCVHPYVPTDGIESFSVHRARPPCGRVALNVMRRSFRRTWLRKRSQSCRRLLLWTMGACLLSLAMSGQLAMTAAGVVARLGLFFGINVFIGVLSTSSVYELSLANCHVSHEMESQVYSPLVCHACRTAESFAKELLCSLFFGMVTIAILPLHPDVGHRVTFLLLVFLSTLACNFFAHALAVLLRHSVAVNVYNGNLVFMLIFSVILTSTDPTMEIPRNAELSRGLARAAFLTYAYEAQVENELSGQDDFTLKISDISVSSQSGSEWLSNLGIPTFLAGNIFILLAWVFAFWCIGACGIYRSIRPRSRASVLF
mmetsp:Transcript_82930/g.231274  ORF Transcript_82930/g.231274 Transcript_82930/m.231274 type:complete len:1599 (-) Transcript_82930:95-4891(-)